jgi:NitT/TauT family transport system substrate-binding protein
MSRDILSKHHPSRRTVAAGLLTTLALAAGATKRVSAGQLRELALFGPPAGPSITMAHAAASGALSHIAEKTTFKVWRNPDEMRAGLSSGTMPLVILPTQVAANLYNRKFGIRLVNVMTNGLLYVISPDPELTSIPALKGKHISVPFRNDTPEYIVTALLKHYALAAGKDLQVDMTGTPTEAIQLVLAGRMDAALVPEPAATAAILRAAAAGKKIYRVMDVQKEWAKISGGPAIVPQAGLGVTDAFLSENRSTVEMLHTALVGVTEKVLANPAAAASDAAPALDLPAPVVEQSIAHSKLVATRASAARTELERMYRLIDEANPALLGGKLPDDGFYL